MSANGSPSYEQALAALTGPDGPFAIIEAEIRGVLVRLFCNAPATLRDFVQATRDKGDAEYLVYENERYNYAQVLERVDALAAALVQRYGIVRGDRVAIAMRNYPEWIVAYFAVTSIVFLVDRAKDIVIRAGENISCTEVENVVYAYPDTYECACFGLPHEGLGEELAVAVYPKPGHPLSPEALCRHVAAHLAAFKVPSQVFVFAEPLPRNASGKLLRRALRDQVVSRQR